VTMHEHDWLAAQFEDNRTRLRAVAYRMLGSMSEADDAVQEAWLRLSRSDRSDVDNLGGWLTRMRPAPSRRCWPTRSASRCSWCSRRCRPPSALPSCCTTCSTLRSTRSRPSSAALRLRLDSLRVARDGGCRELLAPRRSRRRAAIPPATA